MVLYRVTVVFRDHLQDLFLQFSFIEVIFHLKHIFSCQCLIQSFYVLLIFRIQYNINHYFVYFPQAFFIYLYGKIKYHWIRLLLIDIRSLLIMKPCMLQHFWDTLTYCSFMVSTALTNSSFYLMLNLDSKLMISFIGSTIYLEKISTTESWDYF